jgi:hypothetical protein
MNDFDGFLKLELGAMLDLVVASRPPVRRGRKGNQKPVVLPFVLRDGLAAEAIPLVEPVVVTIPAAPRSL